MTKRYSDEELNDIYLKIAPERLWVPVPVPAGMPNTGPAFRVFLRYSDVVPGADAVEQRYWEALQRIPVLGAVGVLAVINGILSTGGSTDPETHRIINERFLPPEFRKRVGEYRAGGPALSVVFNRIGCTQLMRHLMLYGNKVISPNEEPMEALGELALLGNEFIQTDPPAGTSAASNLDVLLRIIPSWDVYNPRDLAYALTRIFTLLTKILPGKDEEVRKLSSKAGINPCTITIDGLSLSDFISVVFGLYAFGRKMTISDPRCAFFDRQKVFEKVGFSLPVLEEFVESRSLTILPVR